MPTTPDFFVLTPADCAKVLARNHVGRLAFRSGQTVDIEPVGYVFSKDWLFMRSAYGAKLEAIAHDPFVAFEVDEIDGPFDWRSVVVHGTIYLLPADGAPIEQEQFRRALAALRKAMPTALTSDDPVPERQIVYGLHVDRVDGRMARSRPGKKPVRRKRARAKPAPKRRLGRNGT
jgi:nitroimidazol reductase NimA-like FMN-containing flavoprotein (pyridoxamine 5'-phosphate oxidase superfamily)